MILLCDTSRNNTLCIDNVENSKVGVQEISGMRPMPDILSKIGFLQGKSCKQDDLICKKAKKFPQCPS